VSTTTPPSAEPNGRPELAQELLGWQLRRLRKSRGISRDIAGRYIDGSESKISRLELGNNRVEEADLDRLLTLYRVTDPHDRHAMSSPGFDGDGIIWFPGLR
jgi:transcriptional regulator with XRE-family HTH domain